MLDLCTWRARIGGFHASFISRTVRNFRVRSKDILQDASHVQKASVLDVLVAYIYMCTFLCFVYVASETYTDVLSPCSMLFTYQRMPYETSTDFDLESETVRDLYSHSHILSIVIVSFGFVKLFSLAHLILLGGDVERQPGPGPSHKDDKYASESKTNLESKMTEMFTTLENNMKKQVSEVLSAIEKQTSSIQRLADAVKELEEDQKEIKNTVSRLAEDVSNTRKLVMQNESKIRDIDAKQDEFQFSTTLLETEIDRLEGFSRRNNVRFFGIPESEEKEDEEACAETVRNVLKTYIPEKTWSDDVIERAHRLGRPTTGRPGPRPLIAKFQRWGDAMSLMRNREARSDMEVDGLKVAQDITRRQSAKLRELRSEGKTGYFVNGQLRIKEDTPTSRRATVLPRSRGRNTQEGGQPSTSAARARETSVSNVPADVTSPIVSPSRRSVSPDVSQRTRTRSTASADTRRQASLREAWSKKHSSREQ